MPSSSMASPRLSLRTPRSCKSAGNESMKPGRLLEKAVAELGAPEHCRKLLDYLDDVE